MISLRQRLVLVHLLTVVAIVACAAFAGWWVLSRSVEGQLDAALLALAEIEAGALTDAHGQPIRVHEAAAGTAPPSLVRLDRLVQIIDARGKVLARSANLGAAVLPAPKPLLDRLGAGETVFETLPHTSEEPLRMVALPIVVNGQALVIQVAGSLDDVNQILQSSTLLFASLATALLIAVGYAGAIFTRKAFRAIDNIVDQAHRIGDANLSERLPHPGTDDEIGHLVDTLNAMLERLERTFDLQRRFTADASHELRSPLSRLRAEIEITLRRPRESQDYVDALRSSLEEVERLTMLVEELLMLARLDAGQEHSPIEPVSLNALVAETVTRMEPIAREHQIRIAVDAASEVVAKVAHGPAALVLTNLLDNALKFSPSAGEVTVRIFADQQNAMLSVADQGAGVTAEDLPGLFERFYRGASARTSGTPGVGLGLSLSQAIAHAYGGRIDASNGVNGGAVFTVSFPLAA
ncbi:sensor histidine kinase [Pseudoduganella sp. RAF53_2]|uniref:sensor histidine kinase n=1 Tax=unclassified Pseudoduganella TaxID=2637179 RepID=UPI003F9C022D